MPASFIRQTLTSFNTTGAIAPSSRFLASVMIRMLPSEQEIPADYRVLEVGAGTGAFTLAIAKRLKNNGSLDVYEINAAFFAYLTTRAATEPTFSALGSRLRLHLGDILEHVPAQPYDAIISGLPFNNFSAALVEKFLKHFKTMLKPGGKLTFFEYVALRRLQQPFVSKAKRKRLQAIARVINEYAQKYQVNANIVLLNLPPARARHMVFS